MLVKISNPGFHWANAIPCHLLKLNAEKAVTIKMQQKLHNFLLWLYLK